MSAQKKRIHLKKRLYCILSQTVRSVPKERNIKNSPFLICKQTKTWLVLQQSACCSSGDKKKELIYIVDLVKRNTYLNTWRKANTKAENKIGFNHHAICALYLEGILSSPLLSSCPPVENIHFALVFPPGVAHSWWILSCKIHHMSVLMIICTHTAAKQTAPF